MKKWWTLAALVVCVGAWAKDGGIQDYAQKVAYVGCATDTKSTWNEVRLDLIQLTKAFQSKKLDEEQQGNLLRCSNEALEQALALNLKGEDKAVQIRVVVGLLAATFDMDMLSSNAQTIWSDYVENRQAYQKALSRIANKRTREDLAQILENMQ